MSQQGCRNGNAAAPTRPRWATDRNPSPTRAAPSLPLPRPSPPPESPLFLPGPESPFVLSAADSPLSPWHHTSQASPIQPPTPPGLETPSSATSQTARAELGGLSAWANAAGQQGTHIGVGSSAATGASSLHIPSVSTRPPPMRPADFHPPLEAETWLTMASDTSTSAASPSDGARPSVSPPAHSPVQTATRPPAVAASTQVRPAHAAPSHAGPRAPAPAFPLAGNGISRPGAAAVRQPVAANHANAIPAAASPPVRSVVSAAPPAVASLPATPARPVAGNAASASAAPPTSVAAFLSRIKANRASQGTPSPSSTPQATPLRVAAPAVPPVPSPTPAVASSATVQAPRPQMSGQVPVPQWASASARPSSGSSSPTIISVFIPNENAQAKAAPADATLTPSTSLAPTSEAASPSVSMASAQLAAAGTGSTSSIATSTTAAIRPPASSAAPVPVGATRPARAHASEAVRPPDPEVAAPITPVIAGRAASAGAHVPATAATQSPSVSAQSSAALRPPAVQFDLQSFVEEARAAHRAASRPTSSPAHSNGTSSQHGLEPPRPAEQPPSEQQQIVQRVSDPRKLPAPESAVPNAGADAGPIKSKLGSLITGITAWVTRSGSGEPSSQAAQASVQEEYEVEEPVEAVSESESWPEVVVEVQPDVEPEGAPPSPVYRPSPASPEAEAEPEPAPPSPVYRPTPASPSEEAMGAEPSFMLDRESLWEPQPEADSIEASPIPEWQSRNDNVEIIEIPSSPSREASPASRHPREPDLQITGASQPSQVPTASQTPAGNVVDMTVKKLPVDRAVVVIPIKKRRRRDLIIGGAYLPARDDAPSFVPKPRITARVATAAQAARRQQHIQLTGGWKKARVPGLKSVLTKPEPLPDRLTVRPGPGMLEPYASLLKPQSLLNQVREYPCGWDDCDSVLASEVLLEKHVAARRHADDGIMPVDYDQLYTTVYQCRWDRCERPCFNTREELVQHMSARHISATLYCPFDLCGLRFKTISMLQRHVTSHSPRTASRPRADLPWKSTRIPLGKDHIEAGLATALPWLPKAVHSDQLTTPLAHGSSYKAPGRQETLRARVQRMCVAPENPVLHVEHPPHMLAQLDGGGHGPGMPGSMNASRQGTEHEGMMLEPIDVDGDGDIVLTGTQGVPNKKKRKRSYMVPKDVNMASVRVDVDGVARYVLPSARAEEDDESSDDESVDANGNVTYSIARPPSGAVKVDQWGRFVNAAGAVVGHLKKRKGPGHWREGLSNNHFLGCSSSDVRSVKKAKKWKPKSKLPISVDPPDGAVRLDAYARWIGANGEVLGRKPREGMQWHQGLKAVNLVGDDAGDVHRDQPDDDEGYPQYPDTNATYSDEDVKPPPPIHDYPIGAVELDYYGRWLDAHGTVIGHIPRRTDGVNWRTGLKAFKLDVAENEEQARIRAMPFTSKPPPGATRLNYRGYWLDDLGMVVGRVLKHRKSWPATRKRLQALLPGPSLYPVPEASATLNSGPRVAVVEIPTRKRVLPLWLREDWAGREVKPVPSPMPSKDKRKAVDRGTRTPSVARVVASRLLLDANGAGPSRHHASRPVLAAASAVPSTRASSIAIVPLPNGDFGTASPVPRASEREPNLEVFVHVEASEEEEEVEEVENPDVVEWNANDEADWDQWAARKE